MRKSSKWLLLILSGCFHAALSFWEASCSRVSYGRVKRSQTQWWLILVLGNFNWISSHSPLSHTSCRSTTTLGSIDSNLIRNALSLKVIPQKKSCLTIFLKLSLTWCSLSSTVSKNTKKNRSPCSLKRRDVSVLPHLHVCLTTSDISSVHLTVVRSKSY